MLVHDIYGRAICDLITPNEVREKMGLPRVEKPSIDHITNCKNCGAPLNKTKYCEYCNTQH